MRVRPKTLEHGRWWDATLNVFGGCIIADRSCYYCYAPIYAAGIHSAADLELYRGTVEFRNGRWTWTGVLTVLRPDHPEWMMPLRWKGAAEPQGPDGRSLLWLNSMADIFLPTPGRPPEAIERLFSTVAISPHIGLVLNKRIEPMVAYFSTKPAWWRKRFWLGFSAGEQLWFERRWELMRPLAESGWTVFVSLQPLLAPVVLPPDFCALARWVIVGGEQAPGNREMDFSWARSLRDQCFAAGVPIFIKQATRGWLPLDLLFRQFPEV